MRQRAGFTLLELSLYMTIIVIIGGMLTGILWQTYDLRTNTSIEHRLRTSAIQIQQQLKTLTSDAESTLASGDKLNFFDSDTASETVVKIIDDKLHLNDQPLHNSSIITEAVRFTKYPQADLIQTQLALRQSSGPKPATLSVEFILPLTN